MRGGRVSIRAALLLLCCPPPDWRSTPLQRCSVAVVTPWTSFSSCFATASRLPPPRPALYPSPFAPLFHRLRLLLAVTGHTGTMSSRHSASSGDSSPSDDGPRPPPLPAERGDLARAGQQAKLALIQMCQVYIGCHGHLRDPDCRHNDCSSGMAPAQTANSTVAGSRGGRHGAGADAAGELDSSTNKKQR